MRGRITYANIAATLALVLSMSGGALAAKHYLISSTSQISPKVLRELKGRSGPTGATGRNGPIGATGATGTPGTPGALGAPGQEGPRGPGIVAAASFEGRESCTLPSAGGGGLGCFRDDAEFIPTADARCSVSVISQIQGLTAGKFEGNGPYFRIAIREGVEEKSDGSYGFYFEGTDGPRSTVQERTRIIPVKAGIPYNFGAFYGNVAGEWEGRQADFEVTYACYGS